MDCAAIAKRLVHSKIRPARVLIEPALGMPHAAGTGPAARCSEEENVAIRSIPAILDRCPGHPIVPVKRWWKAAAFAAVLGLVVHGVPAQAAASSGDTVQGLYDALLSTMKNGRLLGQAGRYTQLEPVILRSFDIASMARLAVGRYWPLLSAEQRQRLTESFGRYISAIYADRFDSYGGQKLEVTGEQSASFGVMVTSEIIKANGEPVEVDYLMHHGSDGWLISDIYLDGTISEVATRRSEFATILKQDGIDGLIAALNRKADILTGTTARSS